MTNAEKLWAEMAQEKVALETQEDRLMQALKKLVEAVKYGIIADSKEIEDLLFELLEFGDYYVPAWELYQELRDYVGKRSPGIWKDRTAMARTILEGDEEYEEKCSGEA